MGEDIKNLRAEKRMEFLPVLLANATKEQDEKREMEGLERKGWGFQCNETQLNDNETETQKKNTNFVICGNGKEISIAEKWEANKQTNRTKKKSTYHFQFIYFMKIKMLFASNFQYKFVYF